MRRLVIFLATGMCAGYFPVAPGTAGTLLAVPLFPVLARLWDLSVSGYVTAIAMVLAGSVWLADAAERIFGESDSSHIVIDEIAGFVIATVFLDFTWTAAALVFVLFRVFDILKPFPAGWIDRQVGGGLGVVGDDVVSGIWAGVVARILQCLV
jgi:phosphatidylglycerophosphatase A